MVVAFVATACSSGSSGPDASGDATTDQATVDAIADVSDGSSTDTGAPSDATSDAFEASDAVSTDSGLTDTEVFANDSNTLAIFEFNGDLTDSSGHGRDATSIATTPTFVPSSFGQALSLSGTDPEGFSWTTYASLLTHPFTIEMLITPTDTGTYSKIFGFDDASDDGWYYYSQTFDAYAPGNNEVGAIPTMTTHYLALVSTSTTALDVYIDGALAGSTPMTFTAPPSAAIFFRDDSSTARNETFKGTVESMRISSVARSVNEQQAVWQRITSLMGN